MKVVAYLRVSTDRQAEKGLGLDVQEQAIKKWAKANGHKVIAWTRDEGISGSNGLDTRIGLLDAVAELQAKRATGLVVYRLDRLARDLVLQEQLLAEAKRLGAEVFSTSPAESSFLGDDPDDPSRALIRQILGAVAQYERSMIRLRLAGGRRRKAERGGFAYGAPPFGFKTVNGELVEVAEEQETIARIRELRAEGASLRVIADTLTKEGRPPRRSDRWHPQSLAKMLARLDSL